MTLIRRACAAAAIVLSATPLIEAQKGGVRPSLSFGPPHPGAYFTTHPTSAHALVDAHPHDVAHAFMRSHMREHVDNYYIRKDSYTDTKSGISHVYIRQFVDGFEVADGDINLNIRDGKVLSYGNSFLKFPGKSVLAPTWHQETFCDNMLPVPDPFVCGASLSKIRNNAHLYSSFAHESDPRSAAFAFMLAASPPHAEITSDPDTIHAERVPCVSTIGETHWCEEWLVSGLPHTLAPIKARKVWVQTPSPDPLTDTVLNLAWRLEVTMPDNQYEAYVSAHDPSKIISVVDWVSDAPAPSEDGWLSALERAVFGNAVVGAGEIIEQVMGGDPDQRPFPAPRSGGSYRVWKWGINDPASGNRTLEESPYDKVASPLGWHSVPAGVDPVENHPELGADTIVNFTTTVGNNVIAQSNWAGGQAWKNNARPDGGSHLVFDFPYGANPWDKGWETVEPRQYSNASITQLFYLSNMYHDLLYRYGFDEKSGNFQQYNFGKGGSEGDGVIVDAQDSSGFNNANFATPPDGQNGRCRMFVWNTAKPFRDGGLDSGILIHELSHGLSTRLTGGPANSACLGRGESGGMGEGWGDYIATSVRSTSTYQDYPIAAWAANTRRGIRHFPYASNTTVNPSLYDFLQRNDYKEVHAIGEVWAEILWVVANKLIDKHGFSDSLFPTAETQFYRTYVRDGGASTLVPKHGNTLMLQLLVNGLKLQPCNPKLMQARDAIIAADVALTGGENKCLLWSGFASRGLGTDAKKLGFGTSPSINGFKVPSECE
ncbi:hypothetical protein BDV93DRAFT_324073 [Ceratobasidium sp. AG-I]|nr:hypothetical protein BDV93DRAFT_324073 [Ceratobasidium sp. AG-I]